MAGSKSLAQATIDGPLTAKAIEVVLFSLEAQCGISFFPLADAIQYPSL